MSVAKMKVNEMHYGIIRRCMRINDMSIRDLARMFGISRSAAREIANGWAVPSHPGVREAIAGVLGVDPDVLFYQVKHSTD